MLIPSLTGAGAERQTSYLAEELTHRGHEVLIGYLMPGPGRVPDQIATHRFAARSPWNPMLLADIVRLIRTWKPDLVQTCITRMDVMGGVAAMVTRVPFVVREPNSAPGYRDLRSKLRTLIGRRAAAVIANTRVGASLWPARKTIVVPNAVPAEAIAAATPIERGDGDMIVYVGRLEPWKRVDVAIRACAILMRERNLTLYVCGDGRDRLRLETLASECGVAGRIVFTGFVENPWSYQRAADGALMLSEFEGHPNAVSESLAAGTPMVLSNIDPHREVAREGASFVPVGDVDATAAAIRTILDNRAAARERTARVSQRVHGWSIGAMTDAYENAYTTVIRTRHSN